MAAVLIPRPITHEPAPGGPCGPAYRAGGGYRHLRVVPDVSAPVPVRTRRSARVVRQAVALRVGLVAVVVALVALGVFSVLAPVASPAGSSPAGAVPEVSREVPYVVQPGDTLWGIATTVAPEADPRVIVDELSRQLGGAGLQTGQRLDLTALPGVVAAGSPNP